MMAHAIKLSAKTIQHQHPGQIPVITIDQPLYSIAKQIQWIVKAPDEGKPSKNHFGWPPV